MCLSDCSGSGEPRGCSTRLRIRLNREAHPRVALTDGQKWLVRRPIVNAIRALDSGKRAGYALVEDWNTHLTDSHFRE